ncbi:MAG: amidohydrolase [Acidobacteriota bacterium]|nr:amidohydrolase [Acidobacteriota bacterium]MDH3525286.1 amidohydrolase [Acidobacteriota bacterium]
MSSLRPRFSRAALGALAILLAGGCVPAAGPGVAEKADIVLRGGRVATVDEDLPAAQAVAIRGAWIAAVGSDAEVAPWIGPDTRVIELDGRLLTPGFIEGHGHFLALGDAELILDLTQASTWEDIVAMVAAAAAQTAPGEWIRGRGWHQEKWTEEPVPQVEGNPVHASLSAASPDHPVVLEHASGHASFANANAMALAGIGPDTAPPPGGEIVRDASGAPTGLLRETAQNLVWEVVAAARAERDPEAIEAEARRMVELAGAEALAHGVTSFHDAGVSFEAIDFFRRLEEEGALPVRLYAMVRSASNDDLARRLDAYRSVAVGNDFLAVRAIKRQIDGALGSHGAWLLEPYADLPESVGLVLEPEDEIRETARLAIEHGYQLNTHAIGDRANRVVLDIYEEAFATRPSAPGGAGADLRWRVEHAQHLDPADLRRFGPLGVIASMQGVHCTSDGSWVPQRIGAERARTGAYMWRSLIDGGVVIANGTDVPVERIDPIASFYASVSRRLPDGSLFYPEQAMTRDEALASYTINNAYAAFEEDLKGSIAVGKLADLAVLSKDILTVPAEEIPSAEVDLTIVGGEVRYERDAWVRPET